MKPTEPIIEAIKKLNNLELKEVIEAAQYEQYLRGERDMNPDGPWLEEADGDA